MLKEEKNNKEREKEKESKKRIYQIDFNVM